MDGETGRYMKFLTFSLGEEEYGIDIHTVQEIRSYAGVTRIANAPEHVKGVINLRGSIVPIIDMRRRFSMTEQTCSDAAVAIILNIETRVAGILVDAVSDVVTLLDEQIKAPPELVHELQADHLIGLGVLEERMIILLDIQSLVCMPETGLAEETAN